MATLQCSEAVLRTRRAAAVVVAVCCSSVAPPSSAAEIAIRFHDDNPATQGATLSARAQAAIEKSAGSALVPAGRDADGAFRFRFPGQPSVPEVRNALNRLRSTGAVVYADIAPDERSTFARQQAAPATEPVTALIVRMKQTHPGAANAKLAFAKSGLAFATIQSLGEGAQGVQLPSALSPRDVQQALARLKADPEVAHVEIDRRAKTQAQPSDPMYASQWNLSDPVGGISAPRAWDITTGDANAPVAVLDTGILAHPDLAGRVIGGYDFVADARFSNDGDGRDADPSDPGDFVTTAEANEPGGPLQGCAAGNSTWHGTMVAGTLGAAVNNGNGMSGVNWMSPVLNVRVMGKCGGALSDVADGIRWAAGLAVPGVPANATPARVINLSLAGPGECGPILQSAITDVTAAGSVVVAAAGNNNDDVVNHWPANCNGVIAVAATSRNGSRAFYTNSGARIAVSAPGGGIGGSIPVLRNLGTTTPDPIGYSYGQQLGSSLAAPHISGIASLILAMDRNLTPAEIQGLIESNARPFPAVSTDPCSTTNCGAGIADAAATLARLAPNGTLAPPITGRTPSPPAPPIPAPEPTPVTVVGPGAVIPPPGPAPVPGGWRAKSPAELERFLKRAGSQPAPISPGTDRGARR